MVRTLREFWGVVEARALGLCSLLAAVVLALGLAWPWSLPGTAAAMSPAGEVPAPAPQPLPIGLWVGDTDNSVELSAEALWALGRREVLTSVPWEPVRRRWGGVPLGVVLKQAGLAGRAVRVRALNGYAAVIPWEDIERYDPLLAMTVDGQAIPVRHKGPILVIYPYDHHHELARSIYRDRAVWHVEALVAL
jgi:hypothetical protein